MKKTYILEGLCCSNCAAKIEDEVGRLDGVTAAKVNFMSTKMVLDVADDKLDAVEKAAGKIVRKIEPDVKMVQA